MTWWIMKIWSWECTKVIQDTGKKHNNTGNNCLFLRGSILSLELKVHDWLSIQETEWKVIITRQAATDLRPRNKEREIKLWKWILRCLMVCVEHVSGSIFSLAPWHWVLFPLGQDSPTPFCSASRLSLPPLHLSQREHMCLKCIVNFLDQLRLPEQ